MRRLLVSIALGVFIPVFLVLLLLAIEGLGLSLPYWVDGVILFIIYWPQILLSLVSNKPLAMPGGDRPWPGVFAVWLGFHFVFYASFTYVVLWLRARQKLR